MAADPVIVKTDLIDASQNQQKQTLYTAQEFEDGYKVELVLSVQTNPGERTIENADSNPSIILFHQDQIIEVTRFRKIHPGIPISC